MKRRTFVAALGTAAIGSSVAVGSGAFTSVSAKRSVSVRVADDSSALLKLVAGDSGLVTTDGGTLQVNVDGTESLGTGANLNAVTTIGDHDDPAADHAFAVVNQGTQSLMFKLNYYFQNTGWITNAGQGQSHLRFTAYDVGDSPTGSSWRDYPDQRGYNKDHSLGQPTGGGFGSNSGDYRFNVGEEYYVVVDIDTTGPNASVDDDLSGTAEIHAATATSSDAWEPTNPPI